MSILVLILTLLQTDPTIEVKFEVDDVGIVITDDFDFMITIDEKLNKCKVTGNVVQLPDLGNATSEYCDVVFSTGDQVLVFKKIRVKKLIWDQDVTWLFRIDNPPFYEDYEGVDWGKVKQVNYWTFRPKERGEGYEIIEPVF